MLKFELRGYFEFWQAAFETLRAHKLRSSLTVVGIVVGVWTVMTNVSVISSIDVAVRKEIEFFGAHSIVISKFQPGINPARLSPEERGRKKLTEADAAALTALPSVELAVPLLNTRFDEYGRRILVRGNGHTSATVELEGASPDYERAGVDFISEGRYFTKLENDTSQEVCVISAAAAETFFPFTSALGKTLAVNGLRLRVIGVFEKREHTFLTQSGSPADVIIQYPLNLARKFQPEAEELVILAVAYPGRLEEATAQITELLRARRQVKARQRDNFSATTADVLISQFRSMSLGVAILMSVVSSLALLIGGIGVMNIMLVSVTERTREIGVRMAVGARRRDILRQFLCEAVMLTSVGGLLGLSAGWLTTLCIGTYIPSYVPVWAPVAGLATSVGVGLIFGLWPAWKAARLNPVEAIRYE